MDISRKMQDYNNLLKKFNKINTQELIEKKDNKNIKNGIYVFDDNICYYKDNLLHREDGPALISGDNEIKKYFFRGKLHRENGPAIENDNGYKAWYTNGEKIKEEVPSGAQQYTANGLYKRLNGDICVFENGKLHCTTGPAYICAETGTVSWYLNGKILKGVKTLLQFNNHIKKNNIKI